MMKKKIIITNCLHISLVPPPPQFNKQKKLVQLTQCPIYFFKKNVQNV